MSSLPADACVNCNRTDAQVPLGAWRYRGEQLWICPDCMPAFIHQRDTIMTRMESSSANRSAAQTGDTDA
jgi:hypothetical protein